MTQMHQLKRHGLFNARVPRYTSYPPANHFTPTFGAENQRLWLGQLDPDEPVSLYIHIPFCRRLCYFCACRTQGTRTNRPVSDYVGSLIHEIEVLRTALGGRLPKIIRLHLGGGTPTVLKPATMDRLLMAVFQTFAQTKEFEFSVEIDPTEAAPAVLDTLVDLGMNRVSIGVQDFEPKVQEAIGRPQSFEQTLQVVSYLRAAGVKGLNMDILYGLPFQTEETLMRSLNQVLALEPDRLALFGYAHVPWMSKRQRVIKADDLPTALERHSLSQRASEHLLQQGMLAIGIDHFARPTDGLAKAARQHRLRRNFQGYTDDTARTLIGIGASAISRFEGGYSQNAVATAAYRKKVDQGQLAGSAGHVMSAEDHLISAIINELMCYHAADATLVAEVTQSDRTPIAAQLATVHSRFADVTSWDGNRLVIDPGALPLTRIIAQAVDATRPPEGAYSLAV